jgi:hypothetical protein
MSTFATIATKINGMLMDVPDSNFVAHQHIQIYPANRPITLNQKWTIVDGSNGAVPLPAGYVNIYSGGDASKHLCLDIPGSSTKPKTLIQLYPANGPGGSKNQQWKLIPAENNYVYIASALNENLVLDVIGDSGAARTKIQIYDRGNNKPNQLWILNSVG